MQGRGSKPPPRTFKASREVKKVEAGRKVQKKKGGENKCWWKILLKIIRTIAILTTSYIKI